MTIENKRKRGIKVTLIMDTLHIAGWPEDLIAAGHCIAEQIPAKPGVRAYVKIADDGSYVGMLSNGRCFVFLRPPELRRRTLPDFQRFMDKVLEGAAV